MAKAKPKTKAAKPKTKRRASKKNEATGKSERISRVIEQAKEPLGLLETLKEEGMARAGYLLGIAAEMSKQVTKESVSAHVRDLSNMVGIVTKEDFLQLKGRIDELEKRFDALMSNLVVVEGEAEGEDEDAETVVEMAGAGGEEAGEIFEEEENPEEHDPEEIGASIEGADSKRKPKH